MIARGPSRLAGDVDAPCFSRIASPVLMIHGTQDEECPARWARATRGALARVGVDVELHWYQGEHHAFGPRFTDSRLDSVQFLRAQGV